MNPAALSGDQQANGAEPQKRISKDYVNGWIERMRASGHWVTVCLSCGTWFAQLRKGRRASACNLQRCSLYQHHQTNTGRAPPAWLQAKWRELLGDQPRKRPKAKPEEKIEAAA